MSAACVLAALNWIPAREGGRRPRSINLRPTEPAKRSRPLWVTIAGASARRAVKPRQPSIRSAAEGYHGSMNQDRIDEAVLALLYSRCTPSPRSPSTSDSTPLPAASEAIRLRCVSASDAPRARFFTDTAAASRGSRPRRFAALRHEGRAARARQAVVRESDLDFPRPGNYALHAMHLQGDLGSLGILPVNSPAACIVSTTCATANAYPRTAYPALRGRRHTTCPPEVVWFARTKRFAAVPVVLGRCARPVRSDEG